MPRKFPNTADFELRYQNFIIALKTINQKYHKYFESVANVDGYNDRIENHVGISRVLDEGGDVRVRIFPRSLSKEIKDDIIAIFSAHFNPDIPPIIV